MQQCNLLNFGRLHNCSPQANILCNWNELRHQCCMVAGLSMYAHAVAVDERLDKLPLALACQDEIDPATSIIRESLVLGNCVNESYGRVALLTFQVLDGLQICGHAEL